MNNAKNTFSFSSKLTMLIAASYISFSGLALADEEFYGTLENRPTENAGIWTVSGQQVQITKDTKIETDHGPLVVGSCVQVEHTNGVVEEIESAKPAKCNQ